MKSSFIAQLDELFSEKDKQHLKKALKNLTGYRPRFLPYYLTAFTHRSLNHATALNNERLEYLGDAVLDTVVGHYLFKKYPLEDEGFLTEMRSKIVSRNSLNDIARRMGLQGLLKYSQSHQFLGKSQIFGNALEALVGAVFLDLGYKRTQKYILKQILDPYVNVDELEHTVFNFKNKLYTWSQHRQLPLDFRTIKEREEGGRKVFTIGVFIDQQFLSEGSGYSKKEAGQAAAEAALKKIEDGTFVVEK